MIHLEIGSTREWWWGGRKYTVEYGGSQWMASLYTLDQLVYIYKFSIGFVWHS